MLRKYLRAFLTHFLNSENEKEIRPSFSPTHSSEVFEGATQLTLEDTRADSINLNFDDSSINSSDISKSESCDQDIFESSPKRLSTDVNEVNYFENFSQNKLEKKVFIRLQRNEIFWMLKTYLESA